MEIYEIEIRFLRIELSSTQSDGITDMITFDSKGRIYSFYLRILKVLTTPVM